MKILQKAVGKTRRDKIRTEVAREKVGVRNSREFITLKSITPSQPQLAIIKSKCHKITFVVVLFYLFVFVLIYLKGVQGVGVYGKPKTAQKNHSLRKKPPTRGSTTNLQLAPGISNLLSMRKKRSIFWQFNPFVRIVL